MIPAPLALGMTVCDYVIVEQNTRKVSLIGSFSGIRGESFPLVPLPFCVYSSLIGGLGEASIELTVTHLESDREVLALQRSTNFPSRFTEVQVIFRVASCQFPEPGSYQFTLLVDGEWVAHRRVRLYSTEPNENE
jgi:hypothetical protein